MVHPDEAHSLQSFTFSSKYDHGRLSSQVKNNLYPYCCLIRPEAERIEATMYCLGIEQTPRIRIVNYNFWKVSLLQGGTLTICQLFNLCANNFILPGQNEASAHVWIDVRVPLPRICNATTTSVHGSQHGIHRNTLVNLSTTVLCAFRS
jgi:hypothetical protein